MPVESSFNFIDDLNEAWPLGTDNPNTLDDHDRGTKKAVKGSFPSLGSTAVTASAAELNTMDGITRTTAQLNGTLESIDEDDMVSNSDTNLPTQQSVKTYVDGKQRSVRFQSAGTVIVQSGGISVLRTAAGTYTVTHNIGNTNYAATVSPVGFNSYAVINVVAINTFVVQSYGATTNLLTDAACSVLIQAW